MPTIPPADETLQEQLPEYLEQVRVYLEAHPDITDLYIRTLVYGTVAIIGFIVFCAVVYFSLVSWNRKRRLLVEFAVSIVSLILAGAISYQLVLLKFSAINWEQSIGEYLSVARYGAGAFFAALLVIHILLELSRFGVRKFAIRGS